MRRVGFWIGLKLVVVAFYLFSAWRWLVPERRHYRDGDGRLKPFEASVWDDRIGTLLCAIGACIYYPYIWTKAAWRRTVDWCVSLLWHGTPPKGPMD